MYNTLADLVEDCNERAYYCNGKKYFHEIASFEVETSFELEQVFEQGQIGIWENVPEPEHNIKIELKDGTIMEAEMKNVRWTVASS